MKIQVYSPKGVKSGELGLPKEFGKKPNMVLLAQAIRVYGDRAHPGLAKAKTRAEVNRTTKKLYRQKGTGGARHGSRRAPIFVGGGVAHGPRPVKRELSLPLKMRREALATALSIKAKDGKVVGISGIERLTKTKEAKAVVDKILKEMKNVKKLTFALNDPATTSLSKVKAALRNLENVQVFPYRTLNAYQVYFGGGLVIDKEALGKVAPVRQAQGKKATRVSKAKDKTKKTK